MSPRLAHRLLILLATAALAVAASGCRAPFIMWTIAAELEGSGYKWKRVAPGTVHAAEEGRPVRFAVITYRTRGDLTGLRSERLVEQCAAGGGAGAEADLPCWPAGRRRIDRNLLDAIDQRLPPHRDAAELLSVAEIINREVGPFRPAYVVGTRPLVIAFLDERPDLQAYEKLASPQPWPPEEAKGVTIFRRRDGSIADASDGRRRHPRLVSDADLPAEANVILMYPEGMDLEAARRASPLYPAVEFHATLLILPSPRPLSELIAAVARPPSLRQQVQLVVTMPLR